MLKKIKAITKAHKDSVIISILCLIFLGLGAVAVDYDFFAYAFVPVILLGVVFILLKFYYSVFLVALLTPFSIFVRNEYFSISVPTEPILVLVMCIFIWDCFFSKKAEVFNLASPITKFLLIYLAWVLVCSLFSWDKLVSIKFLVSKLWFILPCYFMMMPVYKDTKTIRWFVALYGFSLAIVCCYCTIKYYLLGGRFADVNRISQPFYNDHTAYGAAIGLFIPISLYYLFEPKKDCPNKWYRVLFGFISACLIMGFVLSYARATWLSVIVALGVFVLVWFKINWKLLGIGVLLAAVLVGVFWGPVVQRLELNSQDSSGNILKHITSMSNISTDASNVERINRWSCAIRMFKDRPVTGWGPGTYQFIYGSYQIYSQRSTISTNEGTLGNAHSEYIGPLSETGLIGMITVILLFGSSVYVGIKVFKRSKDKQIANLSLFITLGLITYYVHGMMNNFLDTDKLSVPVWSLMAMLSALYVFYLKKDNLVNNNSNNTKIIKY